jgi:regulator of replication initiation timing
MNNLKRTHDAAADLKRNVQISENPKMVIENFKLREGVKLKTKNYVLKNRNKLNEYYDEQGNRRMTK